MARPIAAATGEVDGTLLTLNFFAGAMSDVQATTAYTTYATYTYALVEVCSYGYYTADEACCSTAHRYISIAADVVAVAANAFKRCNSVTSVVFQATSQLTTIDEYAFLEMASLQTIDHSGAVALTAIKKGAFNGCSGLSSIIFPGLLEFIGENTFDNTLLNTVGTATFTSPATCAKVSFAATLAGNAPFAEFTCAGDYAWNFLSLSSDTIYANGDSTGGVSATFAGSPEKSANGVVLNSDAKFATLNFGSKMIGGAMTIEMVVYFNTLTYQSYIFSCGAADRKNEIAVYNEWESSTVAKGIGWLVRKADASIQLVNSQAGDIVAGKWYHVVTTVEDNHLNQGTLTTYLNGKQSRQKV
jgi:hypothetical protein